jgi:hypothetical protein
VTGPTARPDEHDRGQLVLVAAGVVAVALVALLLAFAAADAQRGTAAEAGPAVGETEVVTGEQVRAGLTRAVRNATRTVPSGRRSSESAVRSHVRRSVTNDVERLRGEWAERGAAVAVTRNQSIAAQWATASCPQGPNRRFGPCRASDGLVTQQRAGEWYVVAVAVDARVTGEKRRLTVATVVRP